MENNVMNSPLTARLNGSADTKLLTDFGYSQDHD